MTQMTNKSNRPRGVCRWDSKKCDHWMLCQYNKHEACGSYKRNNEKKSGSGVSCGKCQLKADNTCKFICLRRDIVENGVDIEVEEQK